MKLSLKQIYDKKRYRLHRDKLLQQNKEYKTTLVGILRNRFYRIKDRCNNPLDPAYKNYGGRGIKVKFKDSQEFVDYVVNGLKVDPRGLQIDRIDNNSNYEKGNIRFVTQIENIKNQRRRHKL